MVFVERVTHDIVARRCDEAEGAPLRSAMPHDTNRPGSVPLVSELVTTVLQHGTPSGLAAHGARLEMLPGRARIEVHDAGQKVPVVGDGGHEAAGRGPVVVRLASQQRCGSTAQDKTRAEMERG